MRARWLCLAALAALAAQTSESEADDDSEDSATAMDEAEIHEEVPTVTA